MYLFSDDKNWCAKNKLIGNDCPVCVCAMVNCDKKSKKGRNLPSDSDKQKSEDDNQSAKADQDFIADAFD